MLACPAATRRVRLDEIREGHAQRNLGVEERPQDVPRPGQRVEVHVLALDVGADPAQRLQLVLSDERQRIQMLKALDKDKPSFAASPVSHAGKTLSSSLVIFWHLGRHPLAGLYASG